MELEFKFGCNSPSGGWSKMFSSADSQSSTILAAKLQPNLILCLHFRVTASLREGVKGECNVDVKEIVE